MELNIVFRSRGPLNRAWSFFHRDRIFTLPRAPMLNRDCRVFSIGSCFATEIRKALRKQGFCVYPDYPSIVYDPEDVKIGSLDSADYMSHYNTFTIRQELEKAAGRWQQDKNDYWTIPDSWFGNKMCYQDPYRRFVVAQSPRMLNRATAALDACIRDGLLTADLFLITLGLTEVWQKTDNHRFVCANPGYMKGGGWFDTRFRLSTFEENYSNLEKTVALIKEINPAARIVLTVSPVPLGGTFSASDVFVANMESKSILRAAAGQICRTQEDAAYFPVYEMCSAIGDIYTEDGRHVRPEIVRDIVDTFCHSYIEALPASALPA